MTGVVSIFRRQPDAMLDADWRFFLADAQRTCRGRLACPWETSGASVITRTHVMMSLIRLWDGRLWQVHLQTTAARLCEDRLDDDLRNLFDTVAGRKAPVQLPNSTVCGRVA